MKPHTGHDPESGSFIVWDRDAASNLRSARMLRTDIKGEQDSLSVCTPDVPVGEQQFAVVLAKNYPHGNWRISYFVNTNGSNYDWHYLNSIQPSLELDMQELAKFGST